MVVVLLRDVSALRLCCKSHSGSRLSLCVAFYFVHICRKNCPNPFVWGNKQLRVSFLLSCSFGPPWPSLEHCGRKSKRKAYLHISVNRGRKLPPRISILVGGYFEIFSIYNFLKIEHLMYLSLKWLLKKSTTSDSSNLKYISSHCFPALF